MLSSRTGTALSLLVVTALLLASGCAGSSSPKSRAVSELLPGGPTFRGVVHDGLPDSPDARAALTAARRDYRELADGTYDEYGSGSQPHASEETSLPPTLGGFLAETTCAVIPVYEMTATAGDLSSLFELDGPVTGEYVLAAVRGGEVVGAGVWYWGLERGTPMPPKRELWQALRSDFGSFSFVPAERLVREHLGSGEAAIRYVRVPRGYWVVGRAGGKEIAAFACREGSFADDPEDAAMGTGRVYTVDEVLEYGAPHADRN